MRRYGKSLVFSAIWLSMIINIMFLSPISRADILTVTVNAGDYRIVNENEGQRIEIQDFGYLMEPGKPMLPAENFLIALPPGARVSSVDVNGFNPRQLEGSYNIIPAPPILPLVDSYLYHDYVEKIQRDWQSIKESVYSSTRAYPDVRGELNGSGTLRKYSYASVSFYPFSYSPLSGKLIYYGAAEISINYDLPSAGSREADIIKEIIQDNIADERASRLFINYEQIRDLYQPKSPESRNPRDIHDYVIITTGDLLSAVTSSDFLAWKTSLGYNIRIVLTTDIEITVQPGVDLAEQIRNFLIDYYGLWGIEYVLLVGDYTAIPMRYCYPNPDNHANGAGNPSSWPWSGDVPTDYYYADLSDPDYISWDSDGDGFCGEYGQDSPDFLAEVYVGRIPTNNAARIRYALNKLVAYEQDTGDWKNSVLNAGAIAFYANEDHSGRDLVDGAVLMNQIETDIMNGMTVTHFSERQGLAPSVHNWLSLSEGAFIGDWRNGQYGIVNWYAHGWSSEVAQKIWSWDDGDAVPETSNPNEMSWPVFISINSNLDDDYPSILFALSCMVGYPEPNTWGNLGIDLLTKPSFGASAGIVSGSRLVWVSTGGGEQLCYEFNRYLLNGPDGPEKLGEALYNSEFYCSQTYNWNHYAEYWDLFTFNLYGDPALKRGGDSTVVGIENSPMELPNRIFLSRNYPNPFNNRTNICFSLSKPRNVSLSVYDILGRRVEILIDECRQAGVHIITFDASKLSGGVYFYRLQSGNQVETRKMILLK